MILFSWHAGLNCFTESALKLNKIIYLRYPDPILNQCKCGRLITHPALSLPTGGLFDSLDLINLLYVLKGMLSTKSLEEYDRYEGVRKMMPYAKGISAKTHQYDEKGNETETDYFNIFKIIRDAGQ